MMYKCPSCKAEFEEEDDILSYIVMDFYDHDYDRQVYECPNCSESRSDIRDFEVRDEINNPR